MFQSLKFALAKLTLISSADLGRINQEKDVNERNQVPTLTPAHIKKSSSVKHNFKPNYLHSSSVLDHITKRQLMGHGARSAISASGESLTKSSYRHIPNSILAENLPVMMKEYEIPRFYHDKIFSSKWISETSVVFGTKCNHLVVLNTNTGNQVQIPSVSHDNEYQDEQDFSHNSMFLARHGGIHSIALSPNGKLLAASTSHPSRIALYQLPSFQQIGILNGHTDWIFGLEWINNEILASGSRDHSIGIWNVSRAVASSDDEVSILRHFDPILKIDSAHQEKVRAIQYNPVEAKLYSLSTDTTVKVWDANCNFQHVSTINLVHTNETVCMGMDSQSSRLLAVGSQSHFSLIDPNIRTCASSSMSMSSGSSLPVIASYHTPDEKLGVRSLVWRNHILNIGGGNGRIGFFDMRKSAYLNLSTRETVVKSPVFKHEHRLYHEVGEGYLHRDNTYVTHFNGIRIPNAVYTMSYDPTGTRLFVGGGPLQLGLRGNYAAIWK